MAVEWEKGRGFKIKGGDEIEEMVADNDMMGWPISNSVRYLTLKERLSIRGIAFQVRNRNQADVIPEEIEGDARLLMSAKELETSFIERIEKPSPPEGCWEGFPVMENPFLNPFSKN